MRPTERFSSRADAYARYRPSYPLGAIELLEARSGLSPETVVADVGSGTGILSQLLLARGARVWAIEPNEPMRAAAEAHLAGHPGFRSVTGTAEDTTLPAASVDLWVAAQAFHWFDAPRAREEMLRVLKPEGWAALLWNERPALPGAFLEEYDELLLQHAAEYARIVASRADEPTMRVFFGGAMQLATFPNQQTFDSQGLIGRLMSSSYAPEPGHPQHEPLMRAVEELFGRHQRGGEVVFPYETLVYYAQPHAAA
jgi:SAM-dependent methyltransferase